MTTPASGAWHKSLPPKSGRLELPARVLAWLLLLGQLAVALLVVRDYEIEARRGLWSVLALAIAGFAVHCWLPMKLRLPFFLSLSIGSLFLLLTWQEAALILTVGGSLIGICRLPISLALRVTLLLLAAVNLAVWRRHAVVPISLDGLPLPILSEPVWQVLGAMFMFRLIVYVVELRDRSPGSWTQSLSYFFMLPNVCFPLFPIVDYAAFRRTYYDGEEFAIYRTGMNWIGRGLLHLLLYRWINLYVLPSPQEIDDAAHAALYLAANYALYLRVSGQFHLITGVLHLFGFNLPRTHHLYFLATSFTDIWRRINIYWKDFLQKTIFLPAFFFWRGRGNALAIGAGTLTVFAFTWLLHPYQVFWLQGEFPLSVNDAGLWLCLGVLVSANALWDFRRAKQARAKTDDWSWAVATVRSLQAMGMFAAVSLFWGAWGDPRMLGLLLQKNLPLVQGSAPWHGAATIAGCVAAAVAAGAVAQWMWRRFDGRNWHERFESRGAAVANMGVLAAMLLLGRTELYRPQAPELARRMTEYKYDSHSAVQAARALPGYYEQIADTSLPSDAFVGAERRALPGAHRHFGEMMRPADNGLQWELIPGWQGRFYGNMVTINGWGMRDRDMPRDKAEGVRRIALLGSSVVMGYGVGDDEVFDAVLEDQLKRSQPPGGPRYELLNFGSAKSYAIHRRIMLEEKALDFHPDAAYYFAHQDELLEASAAHLADLSFHGFKLNDPCLERVLRDAGVTKDSSWGLTQILLAPRVLQIVECSYRRIVETCRRRGMKAVWIYLPMPGVVDAPDHFAEMSELARGAGFQVVDLSNWADGRRPEDVKLGPMDYHANAAGHAAFAARLLKELRERPELLPNLAPGGRN